MLERVKTTAHRGLRLRNSPHDGETISVLPVHSSLEVLDSETWLRVRCKDGSIGFVLSEYVEPELPGAEEVVTGVEVTQYQAKHGAIQSGNVIRIDKEFEPALNEIERIANDHGLTLFITSSLRRPRQALTNAVVEPARLSNHHVGHAIDMNIIMDGVWYNSKKLAKFDILPLQIQTFLENITHSPTQTLRWGGRFNSPDPVHIDDGLNLNQGSKFQKKLLALWGPGFSGNLS